METLTQAGVLTEVPQELLALLLLVSTVLAVAPGRDGEVLMVCILIVWGHFRAFQTNGEKDIGED